MGKREGQPIRVTPEDAEFYMTRLIRSCELRQSLDSGNYPLQTYSSGEEKAAHIQIDVQGKKHEVPAELVELPIYKPKKGIEKGLRYGVLFSIFSDYSMLCEMGLGAQAREIIVFDKSMPGGKPKRDAGSHIGNKGR